MITKNINVEGISKAIDVVKNNFDSIYLFESGDRAKLLDQIVTYDPRQFNVFGIYDQAIYLAYKDIVDCLIEECSNKNVNIKKCEYYISSEYFNSKVDPKFLYDFGGVSIPCFNGLISLQNKEIVVYLNGKEQALSQGTMLFFESGKSIKYDATELECIYFNIAPRFMIQDQYPFKWIPIGV